MARTKMMQCTFTDLQRGWCHRLWQHSFLKLQDTILSYEFQEPILPKYKLGPQCTMDNFFNIADINKVDDLEILLELYEKPQKKARHYSILSYFWFI